MRELIDEAKREEMKLIVRLALVVVMAMCSAGIALADADSKAASDGAAGGTIPPGTKITMGNWEHYREFMSDGLIALFQGTYFWKMPPDMEMDVGPTIIHPLPKGYLDATEKYASQVKIVQLPDGGLNMQGYVAGLPFPKPSGPHKGWEILANLWYRYWPRLIVSGTDNAISDCSQDRYGNISCTKEIYVDRWLDHVTDPGYRMTEPQADGRDQTRFGMVVWPEQNKYSAALNIFYADLTRLPSVYVFTPSNRHVTQLSSASRCQTSGGSDMTPDDFRYGFAGNLPLFQSEVIGEKKILALLDYKPPTGGFPNGYYMPLGSPKPSWGRWQLRDVYITDVRRIPAHAAGYCYGKRILYIDKQFYAPLWEDLYDSDMKFWKIVNISTQALEVPGIGVVNNSGSISEQFWDLRDNHGSFDTNFSDTGQPVYINQQVPKEYDDKTKYGSPTGLSEIMR